MKKQNFRLPMNLQFFAEPTPPATPAASQEPTQSANPSQPAEPDPKKPAAKMYTDEEVNAIIDSKFAKWQKEQKAAQDQAERLKGMSAEDAAKAETAAAKAETEKAQAELAAYRMRDTARAMLSKAGVTPTDADLDLVVTADADTTKAKVKQLIEISKRAQKAAENQYLNGDHLKRGNDKPAPAGSRGENLAKAALAGSKTTNDYFQSSVQL